VHMYVGRKKSGEKCKNVTMAVFWRGLFLSSSPFSTSSTFYTMSIRDSDNQ